MPIQREIFIADKGRMMRGITGWLYSWGERQVRSMMDSGYSKISILYRIWLEGIVTGGQFGSRPLIGEYHTSDDALLEAAIARLPGMQQKCVILRHCELRGDDGRELTARDYARFLKISKDAFNCHVSRGKRALETKIKELRDENRPADG